MAPDLASDLDGLVDERISRGTLDLPVFPQSTSIVLDLCAKDDVDIRRLTDTIRTDPTLTAHVFRVANSAIYGSRMPIVSTSQALARLGTSQIRQIALFVACETRAFKIRGRGDEAKKLLRCSMATALFAQEIARMRRASVEEVFVSALLCDVGTPAILQLVSDLETEAGAPFRDEVIAHTVNRLHAGVGAEIARRWSMPDRVATAIETHHHPLSAGAKATPGATTVATIQLARALADGVLEGRDPEEAPEAIAILNLYPEDRATLLARADQILSAIEGSS